MRHLLLILGFLAGFFNYANAEEKNIPFTPQFENSASNNYSGDEPLLFLVNNPGDLEDAISRFYLPPPVSDGNGGTRNEIQRNFLKKIIMEDINAIGFDTGTQFSINVLSGADIGEDATMQISEIKYSEELKEIIIEAEVSSGERKSLDKIPNSRACFAIISRKDAPDFNNSWKFTLNVTKTQKKTAQRLPLGDFKDWELEITFPDALDEELAIGACENMVEDGLIQKFEKVSSKKRTFIVYVKETTRIESLYEKFRKAKEIKSVKFINK